MCLHVKRRFSFEYLSSKNVISDFDIYTESLQMPPKNEFVAMKRLESQARLHFLTFEVAATNSESLLHSSCSRYSRCHIRCSLDSHRMQMTYLSFTIFTQHNQSVHIAWLHPVLWLQFQINPYTAK